MRKLLLFTVGFAASCAVAVYMIADAASLYSALIALALFFSCCFLRFKWSKIAAFILAGLTAGFLWFFGYEQLVISPARELDGEVLTSEITVSEYGTDTKYGYSVSGRIQHETRSYKVKVYLYAEELPVPGDVVEGKFRLRYTGVDAVEPSQYHNGNGVLLLAYLEGDPQIIKTDHVPLKFFPAELRVRIEGVINSVFPSDVIAFAKALLLGDTTHLAYETDTDFKVSGIRHVVAVSGLHVSILFALIYLFACKNRVLTAVLGIPVLVVFAAIAGFTPSIIRACIMQGLMILALLLKKEYDPKTALSFAALIMLLCNPMSIASVSFQLSVGCVAGIFAFSEKISSYLLSIKCLATKNKFGIRARLTRWLVGSVSVSVSAMVFTIPFCAVYFGTVSIVSILTNVLTLWVISFVFYGIMLSCIVGAIWLPAGGLIAWLVSWPIRYVLFVAKALASVPFAAVYTCSIYVVVWLALCYVLCSLFILSKKKYPAVLLSCISFSLVISLFLSWLEPQLDEYRLTVFDVGQGQCVLLQCGGRNYLVDCGGDYAKDAADTAATQLLSQGISSIDGMILTHFDADHAEGAQYLLSRVDTDVLYLPEVSEDNNSLDFSLYNTLTVAELTVVSNESVTITLVPGIANSSDNESGLSILFQTAKCDILITGDMSISGERKLLNTIALPELDVLIAGHHGSAYSTGFELLFQTTPKVAVISVGADNPYGHPAEAVLNRLTSFGCQIRRTDLEGTILIRE